VQERFSACQCAQNGVTGYSIHLYSDKASCFNQSESILYQNFIINPSVVYLFALLNFQIHVNFIADAKKKKEQKQMEKEMQRLHLLAGKSGESK